MKYAFVCEASQVNCPVNSYLALTSKMYTFEQIYTLIPNAVIDKVNSLSSLPWYTV